MGNYHLDSDKDIDIINDRGKKQKPFKTQLLKWIGNKQSIAHEIISYFPTKIGTYYEPFLGSGGILGSLEPEKGVGSDTFHPLMGIWATLKDDPEQLKDWYSDRWNLMMDGEKEEEYEKIKASYNQNPNGPDLLFLSRSCWGGVIRFRQADGYMSTPCGPHDPISPESFSKRVDLWHSRVQGTEFLNIDYPEAMNMAKPGDLVYCDPPYSDSQAILYGAQSFELENLFDLIGQLKSRGVYVVLSIDGTKKSGKKEIDLPIPDGLFKREIFILVGKSMLKRMKMNGKTLEGEEVTDRLLLTY